MISIKHMKRRKKSKHLLIKQLILLFIFFTQTITITFAQSTENKILNINWRANSLIINASKKISYVESRLPEPDRLIVDLFNCKLETKDYQKTYKSVQGEKITISEISQNKLRIIFLGDASISRKSYLSNNGKTLTVRIARIDTAKNTKKEEDLKENNYEEVEESHKTGSFKEITIEEENNETKIEISATKSIKYKTYLLRKPDRFAIDLLNIFPPDVTVDDFKSTKFVSGIRLGQAASGVEASRVVIDLLQSNLECNVNSNLLGNKLEIKIQEAKVKPPKKLGVTVVIDPGHGGYDTGASYAGYQEKDVNLTISSKLKKSLEALGIAVFLTREDDSFLSLAERVEITNSANPDAFISIHANALATSHAIRGAETYYWTSKSHRLAYLVHNSVLKNVNIPDHHTRKARFYVIRNTSVPAVLAELGFLSNPTDRQLLTSSTVQDKYAKALTEAILKFLDIEPPKAQETKKDNEPE